MTKDEIPLEKKKKFGVVSRKFAKKTKRTLKHKRPRVTTRNWVKNFLGSKSYLIGILFPTFYLLFIHDIISASGTAWTRTLSATVGAFDFAIFFVFVAEIGLNVFAYRKHYVLSWFALLDVIAVLSLIPDILQFLFLVDVNDGLQQFKLARVARTARVATRMARLPKLLELLSCGKEKPEEVAGIEPSAIAGRLQERISAKVVVAMLLLLLVATLCSQSPSITTHGQVALHEIETVGISANFTGSIYEQILNVYTTQYTVLKLEINGNMVVDQSHRISRTQSIYLQKFSTDLSSVTLLDESEQKEIYGLSIVQTACTIIILFLACLLISRDMLVLVINPIERMLALIKKLTSTISAHSDSSRYNSDYSSEDDDDEVNEGVAGASGDIESQTMDADEDEEDDNKETNLLVEFVDILAQEQMEMDAQRREEHHKKKLLHILSAGAQGWLQRKRYRQIKRVYISRENVAKELLSTEKSYISSLQALVDIIVNPLRESGILEEDVIQSIFLGLDSVINYSKAFMARLESRYQPWSIHSKLGDIFHSLDDMVDAYSGFINNCTHSAELVLKCKENPKFVNFMLEQEKKPACNYQTIESFMIMPVQRPPRYVMLMEQLAKYTPVDHPDYSPALAAANNLKKATTMINERKREAENRTMVQSIYLRLEPAVDILMTGPCTFLKEGQLDNEGETYQFYLFNCVLLKCRQKDGGIRMIVVEEIPVTEASTATALADSPHFGLKYAFQFESGTTRIILSAESPTLQTEWLEAIQQLSPKKEQKSERKNSVRPLSSSAEIKSPWARLKEKTISNANDKSRRSLNNSSNSVQK